MEVEDSRKHVYHHHGAQEGMVPSLDNFDPTECSLLPKHPKTGWEKCPLWGEPACSLLSSPGEDGWHLEVTGQRRKRVRAQRPSVTMRGHQLNKEGASPEHQDRAGSPRGAVLFINQTGQSRDTPASVTAPSKAVAGRKYMQSTTAKGFFLKTCARAIFPTTTLRCVCATYCREPPAPSP